MKRSVEKWRVWRMPLLLVVISAFGLIAALLSGEAGDLAWTAVAGAPLVVLAKVLLRRTPT